MGDCWVFVGDRRILEFFEAHSPLAKLLGPFSSALRASVRRLIACYMPTSAIGNTIVNIAIQMCSKLDKVLI